MTATKRSVNWGMLLIVAAVTAGCLGGAYYRLDIDADILSALPGGDTVLQDGREIMRHHPLQDRVVIDVGLDAADPDILVAGARVIEEDLRSSGLFQSVGVADETEQMPLLIDTIADGLAVRFSAEELAQTVAPLVAPDRIRETLAATVARLGRVDGIGAARWVGKDPLELKGPVLARLRHLAPSVGARVVGGYLVSDDDRHLLLVAKPRGSGTDTAFSRSVLDRVADLARNPELAAAGRGRVFTLTPVGAFRAALDNESAAKGDVRRLVVFAALGIALLLIFCFSRPALGLFAFLPALVGSAVALLVFSFFYRAIFLMTLGFGGAIVSITVDHGIAYLLFLDQPVQTRGREAAREVWGVGLLATLTSMGAFLALLAGGVPILAQIGLFAALGIGCSFAFVHGVFPLIFPVMPPARTDRRLPLRRLIERGAATKSKLPAAVALVFALVMLWFARPEFSADLKRMNTVRPQTQAAEALVAGVWGDLFARSFVMVEGDSMAELQAVSDRINTQLERDARDGVLASYFLPAMIFPGPQRRQANLAAWKAFWDPQRVASVAGALRDEGVRLGFAPEAFAPFVRSISAPGDTEPAGIPAEFHALLGISAPADSGPATARGTPWRLFATLTPGPAYSGSTFSSALRGPGVRVFDPKAYAGRLGEVLGETFARMILVIGISVTGLLLVFYRSWKLTVISLLPVVFSLVCTLGTLNLTGHPLDLAGLMLSIIVIGMGIDYSLFMVRAYQRYGSGADPRIGLIRVTVFLAAASTLIGFGAMNFADHLLLRSAGFTCFFGILYAYLGAAVLLPPVLSRLTPRRSTAPGGKG